MRKITIILSILIGATILFSSCGKYEEGPGFSLATKKARLTGEWLLKEVTVNNVAQDMSTEGQISMTLKKDQTGTMSITFFGATLSEPIEWKFSDDKLKLMIKEVDDDEWEENEILRLTSKELWFREIDNSNTITILKFEKK